jgi:hypothetical protein
VNGLSASKFLRVLKTSSRNGEETPRPAPRCGARMVSMARGVHCDDQTAILAMEMRNRVATLDSRDAALLHRDGTVSQDQTRKGQQCASRELGRERTHLPG